MTVEELFFKTIEERTGIKWEDGTYGFIMGTQTPFGPVQGFQSANRLPGFAVWKREGTLTLEAHIIAGTYEENIENVVKFLKTKIEKSPNGEVIILGEYSDGDKQTG